MHVAAKPETTGQSHFDEHRLAAGSIAQQVTTAISALTMLVVITLLARTLRLSEFAVYGLLVSIPTYLLFVQTSVETATIRAISGARDRRETDVAVTTALLVYTGLGVLAALLIIFGGGALFGLFDIGHNLRAEARLGLLALGVVNIAGWPTKAAQDALRGSGLFLASSAAEAAAYLTFGAIIAIAIALSSHLWVIAGIGGSVQLLIGLWSSAALLFARLPVRPRPSLLSLSYARSFLSLSFYLLITGLADLVIYSLDRTILGIYRPVSTVGLYEGPVRAHNLLRQIQGAMMLTVMPAASLYAAQGDVWRLRELLIRGTRYVAMVMTPLTVTLMILARPILHVWLGAHFVASANALTIFVSYWLLAAGPTVGLAVLIAVGRARTAAAYAGTVAVLNLGLSIALTPKLGLEGIVIGTTLPYVVMLPVLMMLLCKIFEIAPSEILRSGYGVALAVGALLAVFESFARVALPIDSAIVLLATIAVGVGGYATIVYRIGLLPRERLLIRRLIVGARRRLLPTTD